MRFLLPIWLLLAAVSLNACASRVSTQATTGQFQAIGRENAGVDYSALSPMDHFQVCDSFYHLQQFSELDACMAPLRARVGKDAFDVGVASYSEDFIIAMVNGIEARKNLDLGALDQAQAAAARAYEAANRDAKVQVNEGLNVFYAITTFGLNTPNSDDSAFVRNSRFSARVEPAGLLASVAALQGRDADAERYRNELWSIYNAIGKDQHYKSILKVLRKWLARSYYLAGDYEGAFDALTRDDRNTFETALDSFTDILFALEAPIIQPLSLVATGTTTDKVQFYLDMPNRIMTLRSAYKTGRIALAKPGYDEILNGEEIVNFASLHFHLLQERAQMAAAEGDREGAERYLREAIELLESQRSNLQKEDYRLGFVGGRVDVYAEMVALLLEDGRSAEAFEFAERAKARALVDMLATRATFAAGPNDLGLDLVRRLDELEERSLQVAALGGDGAATRSAEIDATRRQLIETAPELASLVTVDALGARDIQALLGPDEVMLVYFGEGDALAAFVVTREAVDHVRLEGGGLNSAVRRMRESVQDRQSDAHERQTRLMYDRLIRPLAGKLDGSTLTIVPHGPLHYLPFAALNDGSDFLIERFTVRLLPSASVLRFLEGGGAAAQDLLALGNPDRGDRSLDLPGAERETRVIDQGWGGSRVLLRDVATEANFKTFAASFRYLHLASHGLFDPDRPLNSRMLLAPGDGEDGDLTVGELYEMRLNADLVTLSACETGLGEIKSGDDVIGLTRGFLYAGARSVVASLWPVSDEATAFLMQAFYRNLKTASKAQALRDAVVATRREFPHPIYWSAFNLTGAV